MNENGLWVDGLLVANREETISIERDFGHRRRLKRTYLHIFVWQLCFSNKLKKADRMHSR